MTTPEHSNQPRQQPSSPGQQPVVEPLHKFADRVLDRVKEVLEEGDRKAVFVVERDLELLLKRAEAECLKADPLRAVALHAASRLAFHLNDPLKAEDYLTRAIQITAAHSHPSDRKEIMCTLQMSKAKLLSMLGRPEEALSLWSAVLQHSQDDCAGRAAVLMEMARAHSAAGRPTEYAKLMQQVFSELPKKPDDDLMSQLAFVFAKAGLAEMNDSRFESAIALWQTCVRYLRAVPGDNRESIEGALMNEAECLAKVGRFERATQVLQETLTDATDRLGVEHADVIGIRDVLAFGLLESERYGFEKAERLLAQNLSFARQHGGPDGIAEAVMSLAKARCQRGMYQEAAEGIRNMLEASDVDVGPYARVKLLKAMSEILTECGLLDNASQTLLAALPETQKLPDQGRIATQVGIFARIANLLANTDRDAARQALEKCYELLVELPAGVEPVSTKELRLLSLCIDGEDASAQAGESVASKRLEEFEQENGHTEVTHRVHLMLAKAKYQEQSGNTDGAIELLEKSKSLLEGRFRDQTTLYGGVVLALAALLPDDHPNIDEYHEKARQISQRVREAFGDLRDDEDQGDDY
jgi:tetratricopeptide (TPR) repeat protein